MIFLLSEAKFESLKKIYKSNGKGVQGISQVCVLFGQISY